MSEIAKAWIRAETSAFEHLKRVTGASEGQNAFRGRLPDVIGAFRFWTGGGNVQSGDTVDSGCYGTLITDAEITGNFKSRDDGMEFAGLIIEWLQETKNAKNNVSDVVYLLPTTHLPDVASLFVELPGKGEVEIFRLTWAFRLAFNLTN